MKKILLIITLLIFSGCNKKISEIFKKDDNYITLSQYTKRAQMVNSLETISLITATYLNPILKENNETKNNEIFIIGVYNENDFKGYNKGGIHNIHFNLTMNDLNYTKATKANIKKLNLENYPFYNKWMKYYKVYFPKSDLSTLKIKYKNTDINSSITLSIQKNIYIQ